MGGRRQPGRCLRCWYATCPGGVAALGELACPGCDLRPGPDRHPDRRHDRRGASQVALGHDPVPAARDPASDARRTRPGRRGLPGAGLAAPVAGRRAGHLHRRSGHFLAARLRQRRGPAGPGHRRVHGGDPAERLAGGRDGAGHHGGAAGHHRRGQPVRQDNRRRVRPHPVPHPGRAAGRHRGGQPARVRGLHRGPRPGGRPPPGGGGTTAHRPGTARRGRAHHGHHQRAGRVGRARAGHPSRGGGRGTAGDQDGQQGRATGIAGHPERAAPGRRGRPDPARAGFGRAGHAGRRGPPGRPGDDADRDRDGRPTARRGRPGRVPDHPGIADQHDPARRAGDGRRFGQLPGRRGADLRLRYRAGPACRGCGSRHWRTRAGRDARAGCGGRRLGRDRPAPGGGFRVGARLPLRGQRGGDAAQAGPAGAAAEPEPGGQQEAPAAPAEEGRRS